MLRLQQLKKTKDEINLKSIFDSIFDRCGNAFKQQRTKCRFKELAQGLLNCTGRATITGMLIAAGRQFMDWTAAYLIFWGSRMNTDKLFEVAPKVCLKQLSFSQFIVAHIDDSVLRKDGKTKCGTVWRRDPIGPATHTNFIWVQGFIQISLSLHDPTALRIKKFQYCLKSFVASPWLAAAGYSINWQ